MTERPPYSPGCFGGAMTYSNDDVCGACEFSAPCSIVHARVLKQIREFHGINVKEPSRQVGSLPVKVQKIFDELGKTAEEVRQAMLSGKNPYKLTAGFVGIICQVLLMSKTTTRSFLARVLVEHRQYNEATADVYTRHTIQILKHCGVINVEGDTIKLVLG